MKGKYTKEERAAYFSSLRERWAAAKKLAEEDNNEIRAIMLSHGINVSLASYMLIKTQMESQGIPGIPYLDTKTYKGWAEYGFRVRKGERSTLTGITWISPYDEDGEDDEPQKKSRTYPKAYHLFHRSQVDPITA